MTAEKIYKGVKYTVNGNGFKLKWPSGLVTHTQDMDEVDLKAFIDGMNP